jgi:hypothetical protein
VFAKFMQLKKALSPILTVDPFILHVTKLLQLEKAAVPILAVVVVIVTVVNPDKP